VINRVLCVVAVGLVIVALLLTLGTAMVVAMGTVLSYFVPAIPLEFACVVAGLVILMGLSVLSGVLQFLVATIPPVRIRDDEDEDTDDEDDTEFAEQIAEIVSQKLEPHYWKQRRPAARRR
jgi:hypothetical protein